jgi:hypothetical protein
MDAWREPRAVFHFTVQDDRIVGSTSSMMTTSANSLLWSTDIFDNQMTWWRMMSD